jgi:ATP-dependent helicase/nuclease subunit A
LQFLPDIPADLRADTAAKFLARFGQDLSEAVRDDIIKECIQIMNASEFAPLFGEGSRAEVPITGLINGHELISGQIDRLYIDETNIWIIDFKTNRPPPQDVKDVPAVYKNQMRAYHDTLRAIYPRHRIHCGLIWTDGPLLMPIAL